MRLRARTDANHSDIVEFFRQAGASVFDASRLGRGFPDLVIGYQHRTVLVEIKDGAKSPSRRTLTDDQQAFMRSWRGGPVVTITDIAGAQTLLRTIAE